MLRNNSIQKTHSCYMFFFFTLNIVLKSVSNQVIKSTLFLFILGRINKIRLANFVGSVWAQNLIRGDINSYPYLSVSARPTHLQPAPSPCSSLTVSIVNRLASVAMPSHYDRVCWFRMRVKPPSEVQDCKSNNKNEVNERLPPDHAKLRR